MLLSFFLEQAGLAAQFSAAGEVCQLSSAALAQVPPLNYQMVSQNVNFKLLRTRITVSYHNLVYPHMLGFLADGLTDGHAGGPARVSTRQIQMVRGSTRPPVRNVGD